MAYTLFTANRNYSSWSLRPWLLMRALDIPFEDVMVPFEGAYNYDRFLKFSPNGMVPCLHDGAAGEEPIKVWDSLAITEYLAERHAGVWPADPVARAWARCAAAEMHGGFGALRSTCPMSVGVRASLHDVTPELVRDLARVRLICKGGITRFGGPWLTGPDFTAVDAFYAPVAYRVRSFGLDIGMVGGEWVKRVIDHPAMQAWEEQALAETLRDDAHEEEMLALGRIVEDLRAVG